MAVDTHTKSKGEIIKIILLATSPLEVFTNVTSFKSEYIQLARLLHPDKNPGDKNAEAAMTKLNGFKDSLENGYIYQDDVGTVTIKDNVIKIVGDPNRIKESFYSYLSLQSLTDAASMNFKKYLPTKAEHKDGELTLTCAWRVVPMNTITQGEDHVRWMFSRMLELVSWFESVNFCHAGLNPNSICVVPENHGIQCISFYHSTPIGKNLRSISGEFRNWYPASLLSKSGDKTARTSIDLTLIKKTALYLLGDKSGVGVKLKRIYNEKFINFLLENTEEAFPTFDEFRKLVKDVFGKPKFHHLNM